MYTRNYIHKPCFIWLRFRDFSVLIKFIKKLKMGVSPQSQSFRLVDIQNSKFTTIFGSTNTDRFSIRAFIVEVCHLQVDQCSDTHLSKTRLRRPGTRRGQQEGPE